MQGKRRGKRNYETDRKTEKALEEEQKEGETNKLIVSIFMISVLFSWTCWFGPDEMPA